MYPPPVPRTPQEGRKKGREFADEFFRVLPKACAGAARSSDAKLRSSARRLVDIWDERKVGRWGAGGGRWGAGGGDGCLARGDWAGARLITFGC